MESRYVLALFKNTIKYEIAINEKEYINCSCSFVDTGKRNMTTKKESISMTLPLHPGVKFIINTS